MRVARQVQDRCGRVLLPDKLALIVMVVENAFASGLIFHAIQTWPSVRMQASAILHLR